MNLKNYGHRSSPMLHRSRCPTASLQFVAWRMQRPVHQRSHGFESTRNERWITSKKSPILLTSKTFGWALFLGRRKRASVTGTSLIDAIFFSGTIFGSGTKHSPIKSSVNVSLSQTLKCRTAPRSWITFNGRRCLWKERWRHGSH